MEAIPPDRPSALVDRTGGSGGMAKGSHHYNRAFQITLGRENRGTSVRQNPPEHGLMNAHRVDILSESEYKFIAEALKIYRTNGGCDTPIENFFVTLINQHTLIPVTVDDIDHECTYATGIS